MMKVNSANFAGKSRPPLSWLMGLMGLLATLLGTGCGSSPETTYSVEGTVSVGGKLMNGGTVVFEMLKVGKSGKKYSARGTIEGNGHYRLTTFGGSDGAAAGKHRVTVIPNFSAMPDKIGVNVLDLTPVPKKYMMPETSPLVYEVKPGENFIAIEIPLEETNGQ